MKPICTNLCDFEALRKAGQLYVDKTAYFHRLVTDPSRKYFFCARPRRFGKSLGVTTLKSIFLGHKEAFEGLAISMLMNFIKREGMVAIDPDREITACEADFDVNDLNHVNPVGMLYQTGYLTLADYSDGLYRLRVPDEEVRRDVAALAQIKEKGYAKPYLADGRPIHCIGLDFDSKTRQLMDAAVETLPQKGRKREDHGK